VTSGAASPIPPAQSARLGRDLEHLVVHIGVRLAGHEGDRQAIQWIAWRCEELGAAVSLDPFPVRRRMVHRQQLEVRIGGEWKPFPCSLRGQSPGTGGRVIEAPLALHVCPSDYARTSLDHLAARAVLHFGLTLESLEDYRRLMQAGPACLLMADARFPGNVPIADSLFPAFVQAAGAVPSVGVAYDAAWEWHRAGADRVRLVVDGGAEPANSANVVADWPSPLPGAGLLILTAHHDTQADSPGADDNASGVVTVLELARLLIASPRRHHLRLVSFGCEEQLSVGSHHYANTRRHALLAQPAFVLNFDSIGSWVGWHELVAQADDVTVQSLQSALRRHDLHARLNPAVTPYLDHFPLLRIGIPGVTLWRPNCPVGRFFHHRPDDDLTRVDPGLLARTADAFAHWAAGLLADRAWADIHLPASHLEAAAKFDMMFPATPQVQA
jgi:hypothetical protein